MTGIEPESTTISSIRLADPEGGPVPAAALLWSDGAFTTAIGLAVSAAYDTDSNGATVGAIAGVLVGTAGIPAHWTEPLHDRFTSALSGHATASIASLAARTYALAE